MDPTKSGLDSYLQVQHLQNFINRNTPSFLAQSAKTVVSSLGGATVGGAIGKYALPLIEENFPGAISAAPEYALSILKPAFEYLAPTVPATNYIPIALAGIGGAIVFAFTFYRQRNLSAQVALANTALGAKKDKLVTDSELKNLQSILPSYKLEKSLRDLRVVTDQEINKWVANKESLSAANRHKAILKDTLVYVINAGFDDKQLALIYADFKKHNIDDETLVNQFFAESWGLNIEDKDIIAKFYDVNKIKTPFAVSQESDSSVDTSDIENDLYGNTVEVRDLSNIRTISDEDFVKHPSIVSLILESNILDDDTVAKMQNDDMEEYKVKNLDRLWNKPPFSQDNLLNIRELFKDLGEEKFAYFSIEKIWDPLNESERDILIRLLKSPSVNADKAQAILDNLPKSEIEGNTSNEGEVSGEFKGRELNLTI